MSFADWANDIPDEMTRLIPQGSKFVETKRRPVLSKHMAPGYRTIYSEYSCIPDVAHPWDPAIMQAIWRFAPNFVPMWEKRALLPQGSQSDADVIVVGRHALGRVLRTQRSWLPGLRVKMPTMPCMGLTFDRPNELAFVHQDVHEEGVSRDLPGPYLPFDGTILRKAADLALGYSMSDKEYRDFLMRTLVEEPFEAEMRRRAEVEEDMEARDRDFQPYARKQRERISDVEMGEFQQSVGKRAKDPKPFVVVP